MEKENQDNVKVIEKEESFEELLSRSHIAPVHINPGEKVEGVIIEITKEWVFIDIGGKSEGYIPLDEFMDEEGNIGIKAGETINAYFLSSRNNEILLTTRLTGETTKEHMQEAYQNRIPVEGLVEKEIKGGFEVVIAGNLRAFCPYSQMGLGRSENADQYIGKSLTFYIIEYEKKGRNIIVSNRAVLEGERRKQKDSLKQTLKEGMKVSGEITSITKSGAFVDIGGIEGLIPVSEISWGWVGDINSLIAVGQKVDVMTKTLDWEKDRFSFSLKEMLPDPWENITVRYVEGSTYTGKIVRLAPFGAFVTLEPGVDGLIHISNLGKGKRISHPREVLEQNQTVKVRIATLNEKERRISLEMITDEDGFEEDSSYKRDLAQRVENSSDSLGTLGDIFRAKLEEKP